jgi:serine protease
MIRVIFLLLVFLVNFSFADVKIIIKYKINKQQQKLLATNQITANELKKQMMRALSVSTMSGLQAKIGYRINEVVSIADGAHVININANLSDSELKKILTNLSQDPNIEYVEPSRRVHAYSPPVFNESQQWDMLNTRGDSFESLYQNAYYNTKRPGESVIVAVIDTGYTPHSNYKIDPTNESSELSLTTIDCGNTNPNNGYNNKCYGYQFISLCDDSNEPNCTLDTNISYHPDGLDLGTYYCWTQIIKGNKIPFNCRIANVNLTPNVYHGNHVAGTIIAQGFTPNTVRMLGGAYASQVLPIRGLGLAGYGSDHDIINAIYWAIGEYSEPPVAVNPVANQVKVINLSLGGSYPSCPASWQHVINAALAKNVIVVVAAGNDHEDISNSVPANCKGVISVSAKGYDNSLTWYSNFGNTTITASGGSANGTQLNDVYSTVWDNESVYSYGNNNSTFAYMPGTSMATPHVAAAVADIIAYLNERKILYSNQDIISILQNSAKKLDNSCNDYRSVYGCVSDKTLDANKALEYTKSIMSDKQLTAFIGDKSIQSYTVNNNSLQTIDFKNLNKESIDVKQVYFNAGDLTNKLVITNNSCITNLLESQACSVSFKLLGYSNYASVSLQMEDKSSKIVMNLPLQIDDQQPQASGGGGCSIMQNGDDYTMLLILCGLILIFISRKYLIQIKNNN